MIRTALMIGSAITTLVCAAAQAGAPFAEEAGNKNAALAESMGARNFSSAFDFERWRARAKEEGFSAVEQTLLADIAESEDARSLVKFYMAHGLWPEALSIIQEQENPGAEMKLLEGVANYQMGRWEDAAAAMDDNRLRRVDMAASWRGLANARLGANKAAAEDLFNAPPPPAPFEQDAVDFYLARAAIALGRAEIERARAALEMLQGRLLADSQRAERRLLEAQLMLAQGKRESARGLLESLAASGPLPAANRARLVLIRDRLATGEIDVRTALEKTDALFLTWSGGAFEREALALRIAVYDQNGDVAEAFRDRSSMIVDFPESDAAAQAQREMTDMLSTLFDQADLSPMIAAEIFYENIDAAPPGGEGDALIRNVAARLAALDLLPQAAELLRHQVFNRLRGPSRSHTAAELAAIYLADDRPQEALETMRATRLARLPEPLNHRRRLLEARALIDMGDADAAQKLIARDESAAALRLRGDIYWAAKEWRKAGAAYASSAMSPEEKGRMLDAAESQSALRAAAAFALAGDLETLSAFERKISSRLADKNLKHLLAAFAGEGLGEDPAAFIAAYEGYFEIPGGS